MEVIEEPTVKLDQGLDGSAALHIAKGAVTMNDGAADLDYRFKAAPGERLCYRQVKSALEPTEPPGPTLVHVLLDSCEKCRPEPVVQDDTERHESSEDSRHVHLDCRANNNDELFAGET
jgi:hypothetical protein